MEQPAIIRAGDHGRIMWSYYPAAKLVRTVVIGTGIGRSRRWSLRAGVAQGNAFNLSRRPLTLEIVTQKGTWRWPIVEFDRVGDELRAELGPVVEEQSR